jgi:cell wall-associated NlpC family hydrolase
MSRLLAVIACCMLLGAPSAVAAGSSVPGPAAVSWAQPQIKVVVNHGLMAKSVTSFRPDATLTQGELATLVAGLTKQSASVPADPTMPVTVTQLDARLVRALNLSAAAKEFYDGAHAAGLAVPSRFGTETVARLLGLRINHPAARDDLELLPSDPVTRAETAYSVAQILRFQGWETQSVEDAAATFELPALSAWQTRILNTAVKFVGFPNVWGGTSEKAESPFGVEAHGGFDCSGFVWRVY